MITVRDLRKRFGNVRAVDGVSFDARAGAITGPLGANGAGKSTTLGVMAGLLRPDDGTVLVDGRAAGRAARRQLGALLDHQGLYPRLTARENIAYFGELHGLSGARLHGRVAETIDLLGLGRVADRRTLGFSQGERTKVALARALVLGLRDRGCAIVFSSHVLEQVEALCDRLVVLSAGRVVAEGTVDEIRSRTGGSSLEDAFIGLAIAQEESVCLPA